MSQRSPWLLLTALAAVVAFVLFWPSVPTGSAQSSDHPVAMSQGPGGIWIVRGNRLVVCRLPVVRPASTDPPTPECGQAVQLP